VSIRVGQVSTRVLVHLALFTLALVLGLWFGMARLNELAPYRWPRTDAVVLSSAVVRDPASAAAPYRAIVRFRYSYEGEERTGQQDVASSDLGAARALTLRYADRDQVTCYVDPARPDVAVVERPNVVGAIAPWVGAAMGALFLFLWWPREQAGTAPAPRRIEVARRGEPASTRQWLSGAALLLAGALGSWFLLLQPAWQVAAASRWEPRSCVVLATRVERSASTRHRRYWPEILYSYEVNGSAYTSKQYGFFNPLFSSGSEAAVAQRPVGSTTPCYVNPADPREAVLERGFDSGVVEGLLCLAVLVGAMVQLWRLSSGHESACPARREEVSQ
jgi:hypothetical protein